MYNKVMEWCVEQVYIEWLSMTKQNKTKKSVN